MRSVSGWILAMAVLPSLACGQFEDRAPVEIEQARHMEMAPTMQVAGTVVSRSDAFLSAEVEGRLIEVGDVGSRVEAGEPVARIEDTMLTLRARELSAEIRRARARLEHLQAELDRFERLAEANLASASQIDQTRSERDNAAGDLDVARARLDQVEDQIERTRIVAPYDGVIAERAAQAGERVSAGTRVVRLVNPDNLEIIARAPLDYYRFVQPGDELSVQAAGESLTVPVRTVVSVGNEGRHVFELRLDLDTQLPVGQTVRVTVPTAAVREVLAVPRDALVLRGDGVSVFVVDEDKTARRLQVTTGIGQGDWIEVTGPVREGESVIIRGNERLRAGQDVSVRALQGG